MLRIITQQTEAQQELQRISARTHDDAIVHKEATVNEIVQTVRRQGDKALLHYTAEFDGQSLTVDRLRVSGAELDAAYQQVSKELLKAIEFAAANIEAFHRQSGFGSQRPGPAFGHLWARRRTAPPVRACFPAGQPRTDRHRTP